MPITLHPFIFAICPAILPTDPAAAETKTVSPCLIFATSKIPKYAVIPVIPNDPRCLGKSLISAFILIKLLELVLQYF